MISEEEEYWKKGTKNKNIEGKRGRGCCSLYTPKKPINSYIYKAHSHLITFQKCGKEDTHNTD